MRTSLACLAALCALSAAAQPGWRAYPSYNELSALADSPDGVWAASDGGVFFYAIPSGELETVTSVEGLQGGRVGAMAFDDARGELWIGYQDGVLERLDAETLQSQAFFEVSRADQYASRGVRRLVIEGETMYVATDFGVVEFDLPTATVRAAYARIGDLPAGTPVNDVTEARLPDGSDGLWVASPGGVHYARRDGSNLQTPGAWTRDAGFEGAGFSIAEYQGAVYVGGGPTGALDLYLRNPDDSYGRQLFINSPLLTLTPTGEYLYTHNASTAYAYQRSGVAAQSFETQDAGAHTDLVVGPGGQAWVSDAATGLFPLPLPTDPGRTDVVPETVAPSGPLSSNIRDVDVGPDGALWLVTDRLESAGFAAISRLEDGAWTSFRTDDPGLDVSRSSFRSAAVGPDGAFYAGAAGDGLTVFRDGAPTAYREGNSSLESAQGAPGFVVVFDVAFEDDVAWVLNVSGLPLHRFDGERWDGFPYPPGIPATATATRLAIDEFGQKWLALGSGGLGVWSTGADPASGSDDRALRFTGSTRQGVGLPDPEVRDVVVDGRGRVWLGTARGVAYVFSPGSAFAGDPGLATPQWPLVEDGTDYLLRDVEVLDLEVDPAGQVWAATTSGAYLINADGDGLVRTITADTSPLPSDEVFSVDVDPVSGRVFFVTSEGLFSVAGDATRQQRGAERLTSAPQPFRPAADLEGVVVTGLSAPSSQVRVMTVAGDVVYAADVRGGSFRWNGRAEDGRPVPSGVYLVAASGSDGSTLYGKVAVIR